MIWPAIYALNGGGAVVAPTDDYYNQVISILTSYRDEQGSETIVDPKNSSSWTVNGNVSYPAGSVTGFDNGYMRYHDVYASVSTVPNDTMLWDFSDRDWTIQIQMRPDGWPASRTLFSFGDNYVLGTNAQRYLTLYQAYEGGEITEIWTGTHQVIEDIAEFTISVIGETMHILVNGVIVDSFMPNLSFGSGTFYIGSRFDNVDGFLGYVGRWRITMDVGRYDENGYDHTQQWPMQQTPFPISLANQSVEIQGYPGFANFFFGGPTSEPHYIEIQPVLTFGQPGDVATLDHQGTPLAVDTWTQIYLPQSTSSLQIYVDLVPGTPQVDLRFLVRNASGQPEVLSPANVRLLAFVMEASATQTPLMFDKSDQNTYDLNGQFTRTITHHPDNPTTITARLELNAGSFDAFSAFTINGVDMLVDPEGLHDLAIDSSVTELVFDYSMNPDSYVSYRVFFENKAGEEEVLGNDLEQSMFITHYEAQMEIFTFSAPGTVTYSSGAYYLYPSATPAENTTVLVALMLVDGDLADLDVLSVAGVDMLANPGGSVEIPVTTDIGSLEIAFDRSRITTEGSTLQYNLVFSNKPGEPVLFGDEGQVIEVTHQVPEVYEFSISPPSSTSYPWAGGEYKAYFSQPLSADVTIMAQVEVLDGYVDLILANYIQIHGGDSPTNELALIAGQDNISLQVYCTPPCSYRITFENKVGERKVLPSAGTTFVISHTST